MSSKSCSCADEKNVDNNETNRQVLRLVVETDPILHNPIDEMSLEDICSDETKRIIANMVYSIRSKQLENANAPFVKAAGMAANQWNLKKRIFLFCPQGNDGKIKVIFNPTYEPVLSAIQSKDEPKMEVADQFINLDREGCFSVPFAYGIVERYTTVKIGYIDEKGVQHKDEELSGWPARVWQHETDHLNGLLFCSKKLGLEKGPNCTEFRRFENKLEYEKNLPKKS